MAHEMDDLEFLLPSELLTDDDLLTDFGYGADHSCGFRSDLSSPVESVTGSDEDDFVSELTRKLTHSTLRDSAMGLKLKLSGSPQSTLSGFTAGSGRTPNADSRVFSPPDAKDSLSWEMIYAAAEEAARLRLVEEAAAFYASNLFAPARNTKSDSGLFSNHSETRAHHSFQQFQAAKFHQLMMKNRVMGQRNMGYFLQKEMRDAGADRAHVSPKSAWVSVQQPPPQLPSSALNPLFFGETGLVKERVGTGVFMPRRFGSNTPEGRKKTDAVSKMGIRCKLPQEWTY